MSQQIDRSKTHGWGSTPSQRHYITASQALAAINAAVEYSDSIGVPNDIAILDPSSHLVAFLRMDNAFIGSIDIAIKKAKTVTSFNGLAPSHGYMERIQPGGDLYGIQETNGGLVAFGGGQALFDKEGYFIGAVGISGGTVKQDVDTAVHVAERVGGMGGS